MCSRRTWINALGVTRTRVTACVNASLATLAVRSDHATQHRPRVHTLPPAVASPPVVQQGVRRRSEPLRMAAAGYRNRRFRQAVCLGGRPWEQVTERCRCTVFHHLCPTWGPGRLLTGGRPRVPVPSGSVYGSPRPPARHPCRAAEGTWHRFCGPMGGDKCVPGDLRQCRGCTPYNTSPARHSAAALADCMGTVVPCIRSM